MRKLWGHERLLVITERSSCCALMMESASPIRDDVDFNQFIHDLEGQSPRGWHDERECEPHHHGINEARMPSNANGRQDNKITEGKSNGWSLLYCNGYEGEQLEFVQVLDRRRGVRKMLLKPVEACWPPSTTSR